MQYQCDEPIVIDLDDPAPRGARMLGGAVALLILALIVAPYVMDTSRADESEAAPIHQTRTGLKAEYCQPAIELPGALSAFTHLAMPSFLRLCDWFGPQDAPAAAPMVEPPVAPPDHPRPEY